jgi:hypothetical protein
MASVHSADLLYQLRPPHKLLSEKLFTTNCPFFCSVGVHVLVEDVNEFAPKWNIRSENPGEPIHTLATSVSIEEGQLFEEVSIVKLIHGLTSEPPGPPPPKKTL